MSEEDYVGPYTTEPFHPNIKCLIISAIIVILYWFMPHRNVYLVPLIFVISYTVIGWYDYLYKCDRKLFTGSFPDFGGITDSIFKPQKIKRSDLTTEEIKKLLPQKQQERVYLRNVYLFHLLIIVPILSYIGYNGSKTDPRLFGLLLGLSALATGYHGFRLIHPRV